MKTLRIGHDGDKPRQPKPKAALKLGQRHTRCAPLYLTGAAPKGKEPLRLSDSHVKQPLRLSDASRQPLQLKQQPLRLSTPGKALRLRQQPLRLSQGKTASAQPRTAATPSAVPNGTGERKQWTAEDARQFCAYMNSPAARRERKQVRTELAPQLASAFAGRVMGMPLELLAGPPSLLGWRLEHSPHAASTAKPEQRQVTTRK